MNAISHKILVDGTESKLTNIRASLQLVWGKAFDEIYCHHATLEVAYTASSLFSPELAKVSVLIRSNTIEKGKVSSFSDKKLTRYLPCAANNSSLTIPLNSTEILDALCENGWTKLKTGDRGAPKSFPLSMDVEIESELIQSLKFNHETGKYPYTLCESHFSTLKNGETIETIIDFE